MDSENSLRFEMQRHVQEIERIQRLSDDEWIQAFAREQDRHFSNLLRAVHRQRKQKTGQQNYRG